MSTKSRVTKHCLHSPSGRAYMRIRGRVRYLGPHGSPESLEEYGRLVAELAASPAVSDHPIPAGLTIVELGAAYLDFAEAYYRKNGGITRSVDQVRRAVQVAAEYYGRTPASEFGPLALLSPSNTSCWRRVFPGATSTAWFA